MNISVKNRLLLTYQKRITSCVPKKEKKTEIYVQDDILFDINSHKSLMLWWEEININLINMSTKNKTKSKQNSRAIQ